MNPLNNHRQSLVLGIVLALVLTLLIGGFHFSPLGMARWFHVVAGVFWIGLLYYFNVAQTPALADAAADKGGPGGAGITKYVAPRALFWFRWAALLTVIMGLILAFTRNYLVQALTLGATEGFQNASHTFIGVGMWVGIIMMLNVWGIIWPNQKIALGIVEADADAKAKAGRVAMLASRVNLLLSIPMLVFMTMNQTMFG